MRWIALLIILGVLATCAVFGLHCRNWVESDDKQMQAAIEMLEKNPTAAGRK